MDQEDLQSEAISEAWRIMHAILTTSKATLKDGTEVKPRVGELVRLAQYAANLKPPRMRRVPDLDFKAQVTQGATQTEALPA